VGFKWYILILVLYKHFMKEQIQISESFEIPNRRRRFSAYLLDLIINIILWWVIPYIVFIFTDWNIVSVIIGLILLVLEIVLIIYERNTTWNELMWIVALNKENNWISKWQSMLRHFVFNPAFLPLLLFLIWFLISLMFYMINSLSNEDIFVPSPIRILKGIGTRSSILGLILFFLSIIEIFFKCPTFIDKRLWIKRLYKKSK